MKTGIIIASIFLFIGLVSEAQKCDTIRVNSEIQSKEEKKFVKCIYNLCNKSERQEFNNILKQNNIKTNVHYKKETLGNLVYEDNDFKVYDHCFGEFGGYILFKDKTSDYCYYMECHCLRQIEFNNNKYYVTASLDHMAGSTTLTLIDDPKKLMKSHKDSINYNCLRKDTSYQGEIILSEIGITINITIPLLNNLYVIYSKSEDDCCYFGEILNGKIKMIDALFTRCLYYGDLACNKNGIYFEKFEHSSSMRSIFLTILVSNRDKLSGYLLVKNNTIIIGYRGKEKINQNTAN